MIDPLENFKQVKVHAIWALEEEKELKQNNDIYRNNG